MQKCVPSVVLRSKSVLLARLSGPGADCGVCSQPAYKDMHLPAGQQICALCVGYLAALGASEGLGLRVRGTARGVLG